MEHHTSFERALSTWLAARCLSRKPKTIQFYSELAALALKSWSAPPIPLQEIAPDTFLEFAGKLTGLCPSRWNTLCSLLAEIAPHAPKLKRRRLNMREFSPPGASQFAAFLASLDAIERSHAGLIVRFYCLTGLRFEEGRALLKTDLAGDAVRVRAETAKSGVARSVPFLPGLREIVTQLGEIVPGPFVLPRDNCRKAIQKAARASGVGQWSYHTCRHYFATSCIQAGVDLPTVARWLGHQDGGALLARTYYHLADEHSREMAQRVRIAA